MDTEKREFSIKDLAAISGVSIATVSRVLNNKGGYSKKTEERVLALAKAYGYVSNMAAKSLRNAKTQTIGLILPSIVNEFYASLAFHIENHLAQEDYSLFICNSANNPEKEKDYFRSLASKGVDGILCISGLNELTDAIICRDTPVVCIDRYPENKKGFPLISNDDAASGYLATEHLIQKGCQHILFVSSYTANYMKKQRLHGYQQALAAHGLPFDKNYILERSGKEPTQVEDEILVYDFFKTSSYPVDGIIATSDLAALGALYALKRLHISVPEQVRLVGFDNTLYSRLASPPITTIERYPEKLARKACETLLAMIEERSIDSIVTTIPVSLIERESSSLSSGSIWTP